MTVYTIGYEGRQASDLIERLLENKIRLLLDVRLRPLSRKRGFSKTALGQVCRDAGIEYLHDRDLGTPPDLLAHARSGAGYDAETTAAYRIYLKTKQAAIESAARRVSAMPTCLMCYEADASNCHRKVVAEEIAKRIGSAITHL